MYSFHSRGQGIDSVSTACNFLAVPLLHHLLPKTICLLWKKEKKRREGRQWQTVDRTWLLAARRETGNLMLCFYMRGRQREGESKYEMSKPTVSATQSLLFFFLILSCLVKLNRQPLMQREKSGRCLGNIT